ncbi:hypothetical protein P7K49_001857 [Saguinus oedipus]|uniref:Uncharacterized protein n=1 Tax=Saguinus oedipus TaxID=9490 RepID=A0ABQ9WGM5_SAGOE|nr:hypothetical protein P7K49_001857 [Saguinus oedipus]
MLEICLKLVGCKSKKGLSSSSSCYLEVAARPPAAAGHFIGLAARVLLSAPSPGAAGGSTLDGDRGVPGLHTVGSAEKV